MHDDEVARKGFEALYAAHGRRVLAYALRRVNQPADAADVVADVFVVAWRRIEAVPPGDEARLWLYGVARRVLANHRRGDRRRSRLGRRLASAVAEHAVPGPAEAGGDADGVRAALARLPETDREVLQLTAWEGLSAPQVAVVLGVPSATVRTRLHRARRRLRALLDEAGGEQPAAAGHEVGDERPLVRDPEDQR